MRSMVEGLTDSEKPLHRVSRVLARDRVPRTRSWTAGAVQSSNTLPMSFAHREDRLMSLHPNSPAGRRARLS